MAIPSVDQADQGFGRLVVGGPEHTADPFAPGTLIEAAVVRAGCDLELDDLAAAGLAALAADIGALAHELGFLGKKLLQSAIVETLVKRARVDRLDGDRPIERPIFIVSPFRTGTTLLHRLLAADRRLRAPLTWEVSLAPPLEPSEQDRDTGPDPRIGIVADYLRKTSRLSPDLPRLHPTGAEQPEECLGLLEPSFLSPSFLFWAPVRGYLDWLDGRSEADWDLAYARYTRHLRQLAAPPPGGGWLLKSPVHLWGLDALLRAFPDALVIQLHRPAEATMGSFAALVAAHHRVYFRTLDEQRVARFAHDTMVRGLARGLAARRMCETRRFIDLEFETLVSDPMAVVRDLYPRLDLDLDPETEERLRAWVRENHTAPGSGAHAGTRAAPAAEPPQACDSSGQAAHPRVIDRSG